MNYLPLKIWFIATVTPALGAVVVRLIWEITTATAVGTWIIIILLILVTLGIYALLLYLTIKPSLKKLRSPHVSVGVTVIGTAALISGAIHFIRFVPSPEAASPLSVVIASLLLAGGTSAYSLALRVIWPVWKAG